MEHTVSAFKCTLITVSCTSDPGFSIEPQAQAKSKKNYVCWRQPTKLSSPTLEHLSKHVVNIVSSSSLTLHDSVKE